jgi:hypothetical protein
MVFDQQKEDIEAGAEASYADTTATVDKSYKFYDDSIEIFFDVANHDYYKFNQGGDREEIDGVTTVLGVISKPYLTAWASKLAVLTIKDRMLNPDLSFKPITTEQFLALLDEAKKKHKERLNEAGDIGTLAHNALEDSINHAIEHTNGIVLESPVVRVGIPGTHNEYLQVPEENIRKAQNCVNAAFKWMQDHNVRWLHTERKIYSRVYNFSGTLDGDALIDSCTDRFCRGCRGRVFKDRRAITDWKSSNQLSDSYAYQTAAYQFAHIEEFGDLYIPDRWIMRLGKEEGDFEAWYLPDVYFEADFNAFLAALGLFRSLNEIEERRKLEKREWIELVRAQKKAEKAAADAAEKDLKRFAREELAKAKKEWDAAKKLFYKTLRAQKMSKEEAEKQTEDAYPPALRPGAKDESSIEDAGDSRVRYELHPETKVVAPKAPTKQPAPIAAPGTWKWEA